LNAKVTVSFSFCRDCQLVSSCPENDALIGPDVTPNANKWPECVSCATNQSANDVKGVDLHFKRNMFATLTPIPVASFSKFLSRTTQQHQLMFLVTVEQKSKQPEN